MLTFHGEYSYNKATTYEGFVALCHFEPFDDIDLIRKAALALVKKAGREQIIVVPFAHLHSKVAPSKEGKFLFQTLVHSISSQHPKTVSAPFAVEKALHISVPKKDSLINFLNFKPTYLHEVRRLYEVYAEDYDLHMMKTGHYKAQERIYEAVKAHIYEPVIDVACGPGFLLTQIMRDYSKVYANDISEAMIALAKARVKGKHIAFSKDDAMTLDSFGGKRFGTIISSNLFYYIKDREKAVQGWKKFLQDSGSIIFIEEYPFINTKSKYFEGKRSGITSILSPVSPDEITALMKHNGFTLTLNTKTAIDKRHDLFGLVFKK